MTSLATTPLLAAGERMIRAVAFPWLKPLFPENSNRFWWVSSGICLLIGSLYGWGAAAL